MWLLKLPFDQNLIIINYKSNGDFKSHIIFKGTQDRFVALLSTQETRFYYLFFLKKKTTKTDSLL